MKSSRWLGVAAVGVLGVTAGPALVGCGGSKTTGAGGSTGSTTATGTTATTSSTKTSASVTVTSSQSTGSGMGNHSFDTAIMVMPGAMPTPGTLTDPSTTDYYSFVGKAGDRFLLDVQAQAIVMPQAGHNPNDPTVIDTVVTLYMPDKATVWASDDDAWPRTGTDSTLFTQLPADGTYYFTIQDCNGYAAAHPGTGISCAPAANITTFDYQAAVYDLTKTTGAELVGMNGTPTNVVYTPNPNSTGNSYVDTLDGNFSATTDVHSFTLTPTSTTTKIDPAARGRAFFWVQPITSTDGTGGAVNVTVTAKDTATPPHILAQQDQQYFTNGDDPNNGPLQFSFPMDDQFTNKLGSTFTLSVAVSGSTPLAATKNYYFIQHFAGSWDYGQPEAEGPLGVGMNDNKLGTGADVEQLKTPTGVTGAFFVDGNISSAVDVDWYKMTVPSGLTSNIVALSCSAARDGSGLKGFTAELFKDLAGTQSVVKIGPEAPNPTKDLAGPAMGTSITGIAAGSTLYLKTSATGQAANWVPSTTANNGTFYQCTIVFQ